jgi:hypothetical protein
VESKKSLNNGFLYVATCKKEYLTSACLSAESLRDHWPDANITLVTESNLYDPSLYDIFDLVVSDAPNNRRAKLWALPRTQYKLTVYLDADVIVKHDDIRTIFDQMTDADIMMTKIRPYNGKISKFKGGELTDHCGMFMYRNTPKTLNFMEQWWELWLQQESGEWKWDTDLYPEYLRNWDQWAYWWLQNKTEHAITREYFPDDARWNFVNGYRKSETDKPIVIYHHTLKIKP